jgi:hypothetical protein
MPRKAELASATESNAEPNDVVARLHISHRSSDCLDHSSTLVTENRGTEIWSESLEMAEIAMAQAGRAEANQNFVLPWLVDDDIFDKKLAGTFEKDCGFHYPSPLVARLSGVIVSTFDDVARSVEGFAECGTLSVTKSRSSTE